MFTRLGWIVVAAASLSVAACTDFESNTDLISEGPPMVLQVRFGEKYIEQGSTTERSRRVFGFGSHPLAVAGEAKRVTSADAQEDNFRVIMDELLVGNNLEEIRCRGPVRLDETVMPAVTVNYSRVPVGATPDDIARCSLPSDALPSSCPAGEFAICICEIDGGCMRGMTLVEEGEPVGILDNDLDGAADQSRLIDGAVALRCGTGSSVFDVPLNRDLSYWNPSGTQDRPAQGGFDALGPAVVVVPNAVLPTNVECGIAFSDEVVDKEGRRACVANYSRDPSDSDEPFDPKELQPDCDEGDFSAFSFTVEPLKFRPSAPLVEGAMDVSTTASLIIETNVPIDVATATIANVTLSPAATYVVETPSSGDAVVVTPTVPLAPNTMYTLTITAGVTDTYGQSAPATFVLRFTTAP